MVGDIIATKHFGTFTDDRDSDKPVKELVGKVIVRTPKDGGSNLHAYLFVGEKGNSTRYDLPEFMKSYDKHNVAVLCREYTKKAKNDKIYNKLIVITAKDLGQDG